jgi:single-strand DNA-binding protein
MNRITVLGRLTKDIELKQSQGGKTFANFSVAVPREMNREEVDFINCVAFGKTAEIIQKHFGKGNRILLEGSLQIDNNDGTFYTKIIVSKFYFVDNKSEREQGGNQETAQTTKYESKEETFEDVEAFYETSKQLASEEDLPF